jgi:acyl-CoA reductase-like NAD-dependent aldehyde dehydrogenase
MFRSEQHGDRARGDLRAVLSIIPYEHKNDAVRIAHDTPETSSARRVSKRIRSGNVHIDGAQPDFGSYFGAYKQLGNSRQ